MSLILLFTLLPSASAASVTELPAALHGAVDLDYGGSVLWGSLEEAGDRIAQRRLSQHTLTTYAEFSPLTGIAVTLALPTTLSWSQRWTDAHEVRYDPASEQGTFLGGADLAEMEPMRASGGDGLWIGLAGAPFSESLYKESLVTWRLEAAARVASPSRTFWSDGPDGRGMSPGGGATRVAAAFSTRRGVSNPYLRLAWQRERPVVLDITDATGQVLASQVEVTPASAVLGRGGVELRIAEQPGGDRAVLDLSLTYGYVSGAELPSGLFLPEVLPMTSGKIQSSGDYLTLEAGLAVDAVAYRVVHLRVGGAARSQSPHRLEAAYPVFTGFDTIEAVWTLSVGARLP